MEFSYLPAYLTQQMRPVCLTRLRLATEKNVSCQEGCHAEYHSRPDVDPSKEFGVCLADEALEILVVDVVEIQYECEP